MFKSKSQPAPRYVGKPDQDKAPFSYGVLPQEKNKPALTKVNKNSK